MVEDGHEVLRQSNSDLGTVLYRGTKAGMDVPSSAEGSFVLIGLDVDGGGYDIEQTVTPPGSAVSDENSPGVIQGHHGAGDGGAWHQGRRGQP